MDCVTILILKSNSSSIELCFKGDEIAKGIDAPMNGGVQCNGRDAITGITYMLGGVDFLSHHRSIISGMQELMREEITSEKDPLIEFRIELFESIDFRKGWELERHYV